MNIPNLDLRWVFSTIFGEDSWVGLAEDLETALREFLVTFPAGFDSEDTMFAGGVGAFVRGAMVVYDIAASY